MRLRQSGSVASLAAVMAVLPFLSQRLVAQNYSGTYTASDQTGGIVRLVLRQDAQQTVTGTFSAGGLTFRVQGNVEDGQLFAAAVGDAGALYLEASVEIGQMYLLLAEIGPGNQPDFRDASEILLQRDGDAAAADVPIVPTPTAPGGSPLSQPGPGGPANSEDRQLTQLLLSSKWCSFSYSGVGGTSSGRSETETFLFLQDGTAQVQVGGESYYGGSAGSVAGQRGGAGQLNWRVSGGQLMLSMDQGASWQNVGLEVTYNSNGYPILNADGKEYARCE